MIFKGFTLNEAVNGSGKNVCVILQNKFKQFLVAVIVSPVPTGHEELRCSHQSLTVVNIRLP